MARCYSEAMRKRQPSLPTVWLLTDARNDAALIGAIRRLPRGSGIIFRHYHLGQGARESRFARLSAHARRQGHTMALAGSARQARAWGAKGAYGPAAMLHRGPAILRLVTAHSLREVRQAVVARADAIVLSPVYPTRSHPGGAALGPVRFALLARRSPVPVIALGGMTLHRAAALPQRQWAAIDGLS